MKTKSLLILCLGLFCQINWCQAQVSIGHYEIEPHWSSDNSRFWYRIDTLERTREFWLVDVRRRAKTVAFDPEEFAQFFRSIGGINDQPANNGVPRIERIEFVDHNENLVLVCERGGRYVWDHQSEKFSVAVPPAVGTAGFRLYQPKRPSKSGGRPVEIEINNQLTRDVEILWVDPAGKLSTRGMIRPGETFFQNSYEGHVWLLRYSEAEELGCFACGAEDCRFELNQAILEKVIDWPAESPRRRKDRRRSPRVNNGRSSADASRNTSPDGKYTAFVRDHQLWLQQAAEGEREPVTRQLSDYASADHSFRRDASRARLVGMAFQQQDYPENMPSVFWAPDSRHLLAMQTKRVPERRVYYVEALPEGGTQPRLQSYPYAKPGDPLPIPTPRLFHADTGREIPVSNELFANPFDLRFERWSADGERLYLFYNQRGHQCLRLLEVDVATGQVRAVIDEQASTFIHYSDPGKFVLHWLGEDQVIWASERSGWNHLYRYDISRGEVLNPITQGNWNVRRIERIDEQGVWFFAVGVYPDQDPYHEHFCYASLDGTVFRILTAGDGTHTIDWFPDRSILFAIYSRVDLPPVIEVRDGQSGELLMELQRAEAKGFVASREEYGPKFPERFVAKGRDGETDIWGIVHWPTDFDPTKKYAVIEQIYAGPHDHHVPKRFSPRYPLQQSIADAGFVVVQIDGMGTAWRSKAFHDVCYRNLKDAGFPDRIAWIQALAKKYPQIDISRVGVFGGSAGGQSAMAALLWHHDFYKVAVADCGCHDNRMDKVWWNEQWMGELGDESHYRANSNVENAHLLKGHLFLTVGDEDQNVDPASTLQVVSALIKAEKPFLFLPMVGGGHGSGEHPYMARRRLDFFKEHLGPPRQLSRDATSTE